VPRYHILRTQRERERERAMSKNWCFYKP
jgi:hypothetical protein